MATARPLTKAELAKMFKPWRETERELQRWRRVKVTLPRLKWLEDDDGSREHTSDEGPDGGGS
jgi:hypothetical protein